MPCGCQSTCGCTFEAGPGIRVQRLGDKIVITAVPLWPSETFAASSEIAATTRIAVFDGAAASVLELPPALAGMALQVWNTDAIDDVNLAAQLGETVGGATDQDLPALYVAELVSVVDGAWLINIH